MISTLRREKRVWCLQVVLLLTYNLKVSGQGAVAGSAQGETDTGTGAGAPGSEGVPATHPDTIEETVEVESEGLAGVPFVPDVPSGGITYLVSLRRRSDLGYFCSGVLIGNRHVLTAAHCVNSSVTSADSRPQIVIGSDSSTKTSGAGVQVISTQSVVLHPDYRGGRFNDLAILELSSAANQNPVRISSFRLRNRTLLISVGWGRQGQDSGIAEIAQVVSVEFIDRRRCRRRLGRLTRTSEICMGGKGAGSCPGDDGGPIILLGDTRSDDTLVGIVGSFHVCGSSSRPDVHTRVAPFIDWIKSNAGLP